MNIKGRAKKLETDIPAVFIAIRHKDTPVIAKILAAVTIVYALSPIDFIPDFIPVIGLLDDVIILPGLIAIILKLIPADVFSECRTQSGNLWQDGKTKKWYYALPVVLVWILLIFIIVKVVWS